MFTPEARQLRGLSIEWASCYGMPHLQAHYEGSKVTSHKLDEGAWCAVCGRPATNVHHHPPRSKGNFTLVTPNGTWELKPSLIALCGSGTTGCHGKVHQGLVRIAWEWDSDEDAEDWWSGRTLMELEPHSDAIHGRWVIG